MKSKIRIYTSALLLCFLSGAVAAATDEVKVLSKRISFNSGEYRLRGIMYTPDTEQSNYPAITFIGPVAYIKEQSPKEYAERLAKQGFKTLIFDAAFHGDSDGEPRRYESGLQKVKDIHASLAFLRSQPDVDLQQIHGVAICQGVNWMTQAANEDGQLRSVSLIAGHYLMPQLAEMYTGGKAELKVRLEKAANAKQAWEQQGTVEYIPIVGSSHPDSLLRHPVPEAWYNDWQRNHGDESEGSLGWSNRITRMSELDIWGGDIRPAASKLKTPTLMVHSNRAASGPKIPQQLFNQIPAKSKQLVWLNDEIQTEFYNDPATVQRTVKAITRWIAP